MRQVRTIEEASTVIRQLMDRLDKLEQYDIDLHGRKVINAGKASSNTDYLTQQDAKELISQGFSDFQVPDTSNRLHRCFLSKTADQVLTTAVAAAVIWDVEFEDIGNMHDNAVNNTRITIQQAGYYLFLFQAHIEANAVNSRQISLRVNGTSLLAQTSQYAVPTLPTYMQVTRPRLYAKGDYVEAMAFQDSGGNLNLYTTLGLTKIWAVQIY